MNVDGPINFDFNLQLAKECVQSFTASTKTDAFILDPLGAVLYQNETHGSSCRFCNLLQEKSGQSFACFQAHIDACFQAQRFGGKYIYLCPCGLAFFVSLITSGGITVAGVVGGPLLLVDQEEFVSHDLLERYGLPAELGPLFEKELTAVPRCTPEELSHFANLLFMLCCYVAGYDNYQLLEKQKEDTLQGKISDSIQLAKKSAEPCQAYPLALEKELLEAISRGERETSARLLNELLGHIFFGYGSRFSEIKARVTELIVLLSRAAMEGGADPSQIFGLNFRYLDEIHQFTGLDDLTYYLSKIMQKYTDYVFRMDDVKHVSAMTKALNYVNQHYMDKISLEEVAGLVFFSPSYFSKVFKDEMHSNFNTYLNRVRVEKSKKFLLSDSEKLVDIAALCGFEDQSYFNKVFKKICGVSPGKFRELRGQLPPKNASIRENIK